VCDVNRRKKLHNQRKKSENKKKRARYAGTKIYFTQVRRGKHPPLGVWDIKTRKPRGIPFKTLAERRDFLLMRRLQKRGGRPHASFASRCGQSVPVREVAVIEGVRIVKFIPQTCSECHQIVRLDEYGYQVCIRCGLIQNDFAMDDMVRLSWGERETAESDERLLCYDKYHSHAYSRRSR
jgi:hypothetical protein